MAKKHKTGSHPKKVNHKKKEKSSDLSYAIGIIAVIVIIIAIVAIKGCQDAEPEAMPVVDEPVVDSVPAQEEVKEEVKDVENVVSDKDVVSNLEETSAGYCGDGVCQNIEGLYEDSEMLTCTQFECNIDGKRTENNFICPGDCGHKCDETISLGYQGCEVTGDGDVILTIKSSGRGDVDGGLLFYINADNGETGFDVSKEPLASGDEKEYKVEVSDWEDKFGSIKKIIALPRTLQDDETKACVNQRIAYTMRNCKA